MKTITKYSDPGHGWYRVPMNLVQQVQARGVEFTAYSYRSKSGKYAYLEEHCDAPRFFAVMPRELFKIKYKYTKRGARSAIRNYPSFKEIIWV